MALFVRTPNGAGRTHWLTADGWTFCGHQRERLAVFAEVELETIDCTRCVELVEQEQRYTARRPESLPAMFSEPKPGRVDRGGRMASARFRSDGKTSFYGRQL